MMMMLPLIDEGCLLPLSWIVLRLLVLYSVIIESFISSQSCECELLLKYMFLVLPAYSHSEYIVYIIWGGRDSELWPLL